MRHAVVDSSLLLRLRRAVTPKAGATLLVVVVVLVVVVDDGRMYRGVVKAVLDVTTDKATRREDKENLMV